MLAPFILIGKENRLECIAKFVEEQAEYRFGKTRQQAEIEDFCVTTGHLTILEAIPLDQPIRITGTTHRTTVKQLVHAYLEQEIMNARCML